MSRAIKKIGFFRRSDNKRAAVWENTIRTWLKGRYPFIAITNKRPQGLIVLGGDGTILEAARNNKNRGVFILGLNLDHVGFLASARSQEGFKKAIDMFINGRFRTVKRMMIKVEVFRKRKKILSVNVLNDVVIQNILGVVELEAGIHNHIFQKIRGTGLLIATASGSTAYNLSAHGPIVMPDIKCIIFTELMDHNIPTPSIVIKRNREVVIKVKNFRKRELLTLTKNGQKVDVVLVADGETILPLDIGDVVKIKTSPSLLKFVELEEHYFLKSLQQKFAFK